MTCPSFTGTKGFETCSCAWHPEDSWFAYDQRLLCNVGRENHSKLYYNKLYIHLLISRFTLTALVAGTQVQRSPVFSLSSSSRIFYCLGPQLFRYLLDFLFIKHFLFPWKSYLIALNWVVPDMCFLQKINPFFNFPPPHTIYLGHSYFGQF